MRYTNSLTPSPTVASIIEVQLKKNITEKKTTLR